MRSRANAFVLPLWLLILLRLFPPFPLSRGAWRAVGTVTRVPFNDLAEMVCGRRRPMEINRLRSQAERCTFAASLSVFADRTPVGQLKHRLVIVFIIISLLNYRLRASAGGCLFRHCLSRNRARAEPRNGYSSIFDLRLLFRCSARHNGCDRRRSAAAERRRPQPRGNVKNDS